MTPGEATRVILTAAQTEPRLTVLIDGPSGAGKTTFADMLVASWPSELPEPALVRLDSVYPGWSGLEAASESLVDELLRPRAAGRQGRWRRWDWAAGRQAESHRVRADLPLIVEGCGALSRAAAPLAEIRVWIDADDVLRKRRALERDGGAFDEHWDEWDAQWRAFVVRERPRDSACILVDADGDARMPPPDRPRVGTRLE